MEDLDRHNQHKSDQLLVRDFMDIDAQIKQIEAMEDITSQERNQRKKDLIDEIDEYMIQLGSRSSKGGHSH